MFAIWRPTLDPSGHPMLTCSRGSSFWVRDSNTKTEAINPFGRGPVAGCPTTFVGSCGVRSFPLWIAGPPTDFLDNNNKKKQRKKRTTHRLEKLIVGSPAPLPMNCFPVFSCFISVALVVTGARLFGQGQPPSFHSLFFYSLLSPEVCHQHRLGWGCCN